MEINICNKKEMFSLYKERFYVVINVLVPQLEIMGEIMDGGEG